MWKMYIDGVLHPYAITNAANRDPLQLEWLTFYKPHSYVFVKLSAEEISRIGYTNELT